MRSLLSKSIHQEIASIFYQVTCKVFLYHSGLYLPIPHFPCRIWPLFPVLCNNYFYSQQSVECLQSLPCKASIDSGLRISNTIHGEVGAESLFYWSKFSYLTWQEHKIALIFPLRAHPLWQWFEVPEHILFNLSVVRFQTAFTLIVDCAMNMHVVPYHIPHNSSHESCCIMLYY